MTFIMIPWIYGYIKSCLFVASIELKCDRILGNFNETGRWRITITNQTTQVSIMNHKVHELWIMKRFVCQCLRIEQTSHFKTVDLSECGSALCFVLLFFPSSACVALSTHIWALSIVHTHTETLVIGTLFMLFFNEWIHTLVWNVSFHSRKFDSFVFVFIIIHRTIHINNARALTRIILHGNQEKTKTNRMHLLPKLNEIVSNEYSTVSVCVWPAAVAIPGQILKRKKKYDSETHKTLKILTFAIDHFCISFIYLNRFFDVIGCSAI